jgi:hypothetical protein
MKALHDVVLMRAGVSVVDEGILEAEEGEEEEEEEVVVLQGVSNVKWVAVSSLSVTWTISGNRSNRLACDS